LHLLVGEGPHGVAAQPEHSNWGSLAQQRCGDYSAIAADSLRFAQLVFRIGLRIENLYGSALEQRSTDHAPASGLERCALQLVLELSRHAEIGLRLKESSLVRAGDMSNVRLAKSNGRFNKRIEHAVQIEGRAADNLEHVGSGG